MKAVILDYRADGEILHSLDKMDFKVIPTVNNKTVGLSLRGHADMQICKLNNNCYVCSPECYEYYYGALKSFNVKIICGKTKLASNYPNDIAYNVAWIGEYAVHNFKFTDSCVIENIEKLDLKQIDVSQGYSKCNICVVADNAVITSDIGVYNVLKKIGVDVLLICGGHIDISGWEYGFIGGASGKVNNNTLAFLGDVSAHPDYNKIIEFCSKHGVTCTSLSSKRLMDYGSLILVESSAE